jgi:hypothetical protein
VQVRRCTLAARTLKRNLRSSSISDPTKSPDMSRPVAAANASTRASCESRVAQTSPRSRAQIGAGAAGSSSASARRETFMPRLMFLCFGRGRYRHQHQTEAVHRCAAFNVRSVPTLSTIPCPTVSRNTDAAPTSPRFRGCITRSLRKLRSQSFFTLRKDLNGATQARSVKGRRSAQRGPGARSCKLRFKRTSSHA